MLAKDLRSTIDISVAYGLKFKTKELKSEEIVIMLYDMIKNADIDFKKQLQIYALVTELYKR